jgi:hypothetical protein
MMRFAKIEKIAARVAVRALALVSLLSMAASTQAQDAERPYPTMLPLSQYLMDRDAAIALARSAAPEGISRDASVLVLTPKGWETAVQGTNGFVCMAGPSWTASIDFSQADANDAGWSDLCKRAHRGYSRGVCEEGDSGGGVGGNELYDVEGCIPYPFGPFTQFMPRDVFLVDKRSC